MAFLGGASTQQLLGAIAFTPHVEQGSAPMNDVISGLWGGSPEGLVYEYQNEVTTEASAVYTQGTWTINDEFALTIGARHAKDKKDALEKYSRLEMSPNEECESIELLRALENDMRVFSLKMRGDSFSVDVQDDLLKARVAMKSDKYFGNY